VALACVFFEQKNLGFEVGFGNCGRGHEPSGSATDDGDAHIKVRNG
jgi:hypothetical protein